MGTCGSMHPAHDGVLCDREKGHRFNHDGPAPHLGEGVRASWYDEGGTIETDDDVRMPHQGIDPKRMTTKPPERESRSARIMAALDALAKAQHELTMAILDVPR